MDEMIVKARKKALTLLTDRDRTTGELTERLKKAGFDEETVSDAVSYVKSYGYIDDARYARHYIEVMSASRSRERIRFDLLAKGLTSEEVSAAFEEAGDPDERDLIRRLALKKMKSIRKEDPAGRTKLIRFLAGKGFRMSDIISVCEDLTQN